MQNKFIYILLFLISVSYSQQTNQIITTDPVADLQREIDEIISDPNFIGASWGIYIKSLDNGEVLYRKNADKFFIPASANKLITTSAGLMLLGSNYTTETGFYTAGKISKGILNGDIVIKASGDPTISGRFYKSPISIFQIWTDKLKSLGINKIDGNLIADNLSFENDTYGRGWDISYFNQWFAAPSAGLVFNDNLVEFNITPSKNNITADVEVVPDLGLFKVEEKISVSENIQSGELNIRKLPGANIFSITGEIPKTEKKTKYWPINNSADYFLNSFSSVLKNNNVKISGYLSGIKSTNLKVDYNRYVKLFSHKSKNLKTIVTEINKNSNNLYAEQLLKIIGHEIYNYGSTEKGIFAIKDLFKNIGINPENISIADGCGLSRLNLLTPKQLDKLLSYMYISDEFNSFYESLPVAGTDGSLAERMQRSAATNNVRAKSGFLPGVSSLSGYLKTSDGEAITFTILINNYLVPVSLANNIQDAICIRLANFKR